MLGYIQHQGESIATNGAFHVGTVKDPVTGYYDTSKVRSFPTLDEAKAFIDAGKPAKFDYAASLALFLVEKTGSTLQTWVGKLTAAEQRALCGRFIGKGRIVIDGEQEIISNRVSVCFGHDYDDRNVTAWRSL